LEWSIPSPPPIYNFAVIPTVDQLDPLWAIKRGHAPEPTMHYEDIHLPKNTPLGLFIGFFSLIFGFAMTWHIFWLALVSFIAIVICLIVRLSGKDEHEIIPAAEVKKMEKAARAGRLGLA
jgi:cytochrome o ubiquinol oxidase subunit 1